MEVRTSTTHSRMKLRTPFQETRSRCMGVLWYSPIKNVQLQTLTTQYFLLSRPRSSQRWVLRNSPDHGPPGPIFAGFILSSQIIGTTTGKLPF